MKIQSMRFSKNTGVSAMMAGLLSMGGWASLAQADTSGFALTSPDLANSTFDAKFVLNGFGCKGGNVSPALNWTHAPTGTKSFSVQMNDLDAPTGSGLWHWAVYNLPATVTGLAQGAGNSAAALPAPAFGGNSDFLDTGATGGNGNYGGPCPPVGDKPHRYVFTVYALGVEDVQAAAGIPKSGTAALYSFIFNKGIGAGLLGKASLTVKFAR